MDLKSYLAYYLKLNNQISLNNGHVRILINFFSSSQSLRS